MPELGPRVTIIDDDAETRRLMTDILEMEGYAVTSLESIEPNLSRLADSRPDLLIIDLQLRREPSELDGWDVVLLSKAHRELRTTPILVVSADYPELRRRTAAAAAMSGVQLLSKPFSLDSLAVMARDALRPSSADAQPELGGEEGMWRQPEGSS